MGHGHFLRFAAVLFGAMLAFHAPSVSIRDVLAHGEEASPKQAADSTEVQRTPSTVGAFRGRVLDDVTGKPAAGVLVTIQATKQSLSARADEVLRETRTDANGEFALSELPLLTYNLWATAADRTGAALNSIPVVEGETSAVDDLHLVEGCWLEGRVLTLRGEPLGRDPQTGEPLQIGLSGPSRPRSGASIETCLVDEDGRFRLRVPPGRNFPCIVAPDVWQRIWRKEVYSRGISVAEADRTVAVKFHFVEKDLQNRVKGAHPARDPVKLPPPVVDEWDCAETIRDLGGWYKLDADRHVVEINMVYNDETGQRYDNSDTASDEALQISPAFSRLKRLYLHRGQATDESLASLADLKGLERFFIWDATEVTDAGAIHLAELENLEMVHLSNSSVGDATLEALSKLPKLSRISMQGNAFTDAGLAHLANMRQLRSLWIGMSKGAITDEGMVHLSGLENLVDLDLQKSQITDAGLVHLQGLKNLRQLFLGNSTVTDEGLRDLHEALPNLQALK